MADKQTIYVDVDDEITSVIDKVQAASGRIVALVLPKRAAVFQSIVNMKLLKRSADRASKQVVLITSETNLLPLAGSVGLYVAETLQSKPAIPSAPAVESTAAAADEPIPLDNTPADAKELDLAKAADKPVGDLAAKPTMPLPDKGMEKLELPDEPAVPAPAKTPKKAKKGKKFNIPDFNRFRKLLFFGALALILLIIAGIFAFKILPKATIIIKSNTSPINTSQNISLDTKASQLDPTGLVVPAKVEETQKSSSKTVNATGQKNIGSKAAGSVTMTAKKCSGNPFVVPSSVPAGTGVSINGLTFITQQGTTFYGSGTDSSGCFIYSSSSATPIAATSPGAQYNVNGNFSVSGRSDVSAQGSTNGGSDNVVQIVQQSDIDSAKQQLSKPDSNAIKDDLKQRLKQDGVFAITATFNNGAPTTTTSAAVGTQANSVTVTQSYDYKMYGAKKGDLNKLITAAANGQIDTSQQGIVDTGLSSADFKVINSSGNTLQISMDATATAGPKIDVTELKKQVGGKKSGDIKSMISNYPGVSDVQVNFSPFWVSSAPANPNKITIKFVKS